MTVTLKKSLLMWIVLLLGIKAYAQCDIGDLIVSNVRCTENSYYELDLNFSVNNNGIDSFDVYSNNRFLSRHSVYELPVHIYNDTYNGSDTIDILKVVDYNNPDCFSIKEVNNPCPCVIFDFEYTKFDCTDSTFKILLDFKYLRASDSFQIGMRENYWGKFSYEELPLKLDNFHVRDTVYDPIVVDLENPVFCSEGFVVDPYACPKCKIDNLKLISYECDNNYDINLHLSFDYKYNSLDGYDIHIPEIDYLKKIQYSNSNINSEKIFTDSIILTGVEMTCEEPIQIKLTDIEDNECFTSITVDSLCCEICKLNDISYKIEFDTIDSYWITIDDISRGNSSDSFQMYSNGEYIDKFAYSELPIKTEKYPCEEEQQLEFVIRDLYYTNCDVSFSIEDVTCPTSSVANIEKNVNWHIYTNYDSKKLIVQSINTNFNHEKLVVYNSVGNIIKSERLPNGKSYSEINLQTIKTGIYFVSIFTNNRPIISRKIFIETFE